MEQKLRFGVSVAERPLSVTAEPKQFQKSRKISGSNFKRPRKPNSSLTAARWSSQISPWVRKGEYIFLITFLRRMKPYVVE